MSERDQDDLTDYEEFEGEQGEILDIDEYMAEACIDDDGVIRELNFNFPPENFTYDERDIDYIPDEDDRETPLSERDQDPAEDNAEDGALPAEFKDGGAV